MVLDDTVNMIRQLYGHTLGDLTVERVEVGVFFTGVKLSNGCAGIAYTPVDDMSEKVCCHSAGAGKPARRVFCGASVDQLLDLKQAGPVARAVKTATLNALSSRFLLNGDYDVVYDADALDLINLESIGETSMVGAFIAYLKRLKAIKGIRFHVVEKKKETLKADELKYYVLAELASEVLPLSDTVIITGSTLANGTIDGLLEHVQRHAMVILVGPTASLLPDAFFARGVSLVGGSIVTDADGSLDALAEGFGAHTLFAERCIRKINIFNGQHAVRQTSPLPSACIEERKDEH